MNYLNYVLLFVAGFAEFVIKVVDYKAMQRSKCLYSSIITIISIYVWFYIIASLVNDLSNLKLLFTYAMGCAIGNYVMLKLDIVFNKKEKASKKEEEDRYKFTNWIDFSR